VSGIPGGGSHDLIES